MTRLLQNDLTNFGRLMYLEDVMKAAKLRSPTDATRLMRAVGIVMTDKGACVLKEELSDYCDREGIDLCLLQIIRPAL